MISAIALRRRLYLIEILHQTTTWDSHFCNRRKLYLIEILHQTTTRTCSAVQARCCILSKFYIKPQLVADADIEGMSCILSKFYIKPQLAWIVPYSAIVVSYRNSTSNHNSSEVVFDEVVVVSYRNSTSNHNSSETIIVTRRLYLIEILHQTTTFGYSSILERCCILSKFYIKPQHLTLIGKNNLSCILSKFYIKPQLRDWLRYVCTVVSYRNSTSNHNFLAINLYA